MLRRFTFALAPRSSSSSSLVGLAMNVMAEHDEARQLAEDENDLPQFGTTMSSAQAAARTRPAWIDRDAERASAVEEHRRSDAYVELHRKPTKHSDLGLYGGEAGFEKTPRVWIDPDNPHVPHLYNKAPLSINMTWSRYGHFKRELHIIDVDKLCRHARMVPAVDKLLTDLTSARVALDDDQCSALIRHGARTLRHLAGSAEDQFFGRIQETFERFLLSVAPPMYAGPRTHADMIRVCALVGKWHEGFHQYRQRAVEESEEEEKRLRQLEEAEEKDDDDDHDGTRSNKNDDDDENHSIREAAFSVASSPQPRFELGADFYDAVIELCVACDQHDESINQLRELIQSGHRPRVSSFTNALVSATVLAEQARQEFRQVVSDLRQQREGQENDDDDDDDGEGDSGKHFHEKLVAAEQQLQEQLETSSVVGDEIWRLMELYEREPDSRFFEARAAFAATVRPSLAWENVREALSFNARHKDEAQERSHARSFGDAPHQQQPHHALVNNSKLGVAAKTVGALTPKMISWTLLALARSSSNSSNSNDVDDGRIVTPDDILKLLSVASSQGIALDYEHLTFALHFCEVKAPQSSPSSLSSSSFSCGDLAAHLVGEKASQLSVNVTPEMALLAIRCFSQLPDLLSSSPSTDTYASVALRAVAAAEATNRNSPVFPAIYYALMQLLARMGAMATFSSSMRKYMLTHGNNAAVTMQQQQQQQQQQNTTTRPPSWLLRNFLWCNSVALEPNGGHRATEEALQFLRFSGPETAITRELIAALVMCRLSHGAFSPSVKKILSTFELDTVDLVVVDENVETSASHDDNDDRADDATSTTTTSEEAATRSLLQVVETCAAVITSTQRNANTNQLPHQAKSLQAALDETSSSSDNNAQQDVVEQFDQAVVDVALPGSFTELEACSLVSDFLVVAASASGNSSGGDNLSDESMIDIALFTGLPSERDADPQLPQLTEEFTATPSSLRSLRVAWTFDVEDVWLRRNGQRLPIRNPSRGIPVTEHVQPFSSSGEV